MSFPREKKDLEDRKAVKQGAKDMPAKETAAFAVGGWNSRHSLIRC